MAELSVFWQQIKLSLSTCQSVREFDVVKIVCFKSCFGSEAMFNAIFSTCLLLPGNYVWELVYLPLC